LSTRSARRKDRPGWRRCAFETIDPATFGSIDWVLTYMDTPITFLP
jgi:hypothetical protein